jgi:NAD dependent epimerase/dehydratase family enzyme
MLLPFKLGLGGPLAGGKQWMAMVALQDAIGAMVHAVTTELEGPVNVTSHPATNANFTKALGQALHRPTVLPVPSIALRAMFGGAETRELLLASQRVLPTKLEASGYTLEAPEVNGVVASALADQRD